ncbi:MAG: hypothetical protein U0W24_17715 [Bacteroidales bacterium]
MVKAFFKMFDEVYLKNNNRVNEFHKTMKDGEQAEPEKKLLERMKSYMIQSAVTNLWFCTLHGKKATFAEMKNAILLGAITPVLDDLVDEYRLNSNEVWDAITGNSNKLPQKYDAAKFMYNTLNQNSDNSYKPFLSNALQSQDLSLLQLKNEKLGIDSLYKITLKKGGQWTLLYRSILANKLIKPEIEVVLQLGGLLQITNDAFDVYKDFKNGQQTIFTNAKDIKQIYDHFKNDCINFSTNFLKMDYRRKNKFLALAMIFTILSRAMVCQLQLIKCQVKTGNSFELEKYNRSELICDMEKPINNLRSFWLSIKFLVKII